MTLQEFKKDIFSGIKELPENWRKGQKVFNYIDKKYGVARTVQFDYHIDCFYNNNLIDKFIEESYKLL
jgi:hypothetical protein